MTNPMTWKDLIVLYADGRPICNCGDAYYSPCGKGYKGGEYRTDLLACKHGCSANQMAARDYIAARVGRDLKHSK